MNTNLHQLSLIAGLVLLPALVGTAAHAADRARAPLNDPPMSWRAAPAKRHTVPMRSVATELTPFPAATAQFSAATPSLHETGRVASPGFGAALLAVCEIPIESRGERALAARPAPTLVPAQSIVGEELAALHGESIGNSFKQCRIEVARRRQVLLGEVDVGSLQLRWTVQPTGEVRNSEAVSSTGTDLIVAACMKRVVAMRSFGLQLATLTVERTYAYRF